VFFTMGCHAKPVRAGRVRHGDGRGRGSPDWAQTLAAANVAVYVANTGFGIGDSASVAYSERLMALFAKLLDGSMTVGQALTWAKQSYYGSLGAVGVYDSKILQQTAFYGLPFWEVDTGHPAPAAPTRPALPGVMTPDVATGLQAVEVELNPDLAPVSAAGRTHWTVRGQDPQVTQFQPIQPRLSVPVGDSGLVAHGALIGTLESHDVAGVTPNAPPGRRHVGCRTTGPLRTTRRGRPRSRRSPRRRRPMDETSTCGHTRSVHRLHVRRHGCPAAL
jgi:hypothetical protein